MLLLLHLHLVNLFIIIGVSKIIFYYSLTIAMPVRIAIAKRCRTADAPAHDERASAAQARIEVVGEGEVVLQIIQWFRTMHEA